VHTASVDKLPGLLRRLCVSPKSNKITIARLRWQPAPPAYRYYDADQFPRRLWVISDDTPATETAKLAQELMRLAQMLKREGPLTTED
jgi:hypothetical protein